jgi:hypothetical protein
MREETAVWYLNSSATRIVETNNRSSHQQGLVHHLKIVSTALGLVGHITFGGILIYISSYLTDLFRVGHGKRAAKHGEVLNDRFFTI